MDTVEELVESADLANGTSDALSIASAAALVTAWRNDSLAAAAAVLANASAAVVTNAGPVRHLDPSTQVSAK